MFGDSPEVLPALIEILVEGVEHCGLLTPVHLGGRGQGVQGREGKGGRAEVNGRERRM